MPIIEVKNLSKKYTIGQQQGYVAMRDVLANIAKAPVKWLGGKVSGNVAMTEFWALDDINFNIKKGEVLGIIGRNGAGKSTLLKILSRITPPTKGEIRLGGRVGSLLEVGTGFHPELTGRENIYLNGAILGMRKKEIEMKFDEIVNFAGIEKFLDTPVKRYSSGMYVRLAFSVAAHLEPDILIIDEVLAVGDAEFQKKCLGKMEEVTNKEGRTIIFVSHNMEAIKKLCPRSILLDRGKIIADGESSKVIDDYLKNSLNSETGSLADRKDRRGNGKLKVTGYSLRDEAGKIVPSFSCGQNVQLWLEYEVFDDKIEEINISIGIDSILDQNRIAYLSNQVIDKHLKINEKKIIKIEISKLPLNLGRYQFTIFIDQFGEVLDWVQAAGILEVEEGYFYPTGNLPPAQGQGHLLLNYDIKNS